MIYATAEEQKLLVQKFRAADQSDIVTERNTENISITDSEGHLVIVSNAGGQSKTTPDEYLSDDFDPGLVPQTTEKYPVQGAEIDSIQMLNGQGQAVNILQPGASYQFIVSGRFLNTLTGVSFGISIKSTSGVIITGQRYPEEGNYVELIEAGKSFSLNYGFRMDVLPGAYFVGGGIWTSQQTICAHRIIDALMFRVVHNKKQYSFGYVNSATGETKLEII